MKVNGTKKTIINVMIFSLIFINALQLENSSATSLKSQKVVALENNLNSVAASDADISNFTLNIEGETTRISDPQIARDASGNIFLLWGGEINDDIGGSDDGLLIQKFSSTLDPLSNPILIFNRSSYTSESTELSTYHLFTDNNGDIGIFWYMMNIPDGYQTPQTGEVLFQKRDKDLNLLISPKIIAIHHHSGWSSSNFDEVILGAEIDNENNYHILLEEGQYLYLNSQGKQINQFSFDEDQFSEDGLLFFQDRDNIYITLSNGTEFCEIIHFAIENEEIIKKESKVIESPGEVYYAYIRVIDFTKYLKIYYRDDSETAMYNRQIKAYEITSQFEIKDINNLWTDIRYRSYYFNSDYCGFFYGYGIDYESHTYTLSYGIHSAFENISYIEAQPILYIKNNLSYTYGPSVYGFSPLYTANEEIYLTFYLNNGINGFQLYLWKLDYYGISLSPLVKVSPTREYYNIDNSYTHEIYDFDPHTQTKLNIPAYSEILTILGFSIIFLVFRLNNKRKSQ